MSVDPNGPLFTPEGYLIDYVSGVKVTATPEEVEAVQVFSKMLVEDYGYPKEHIQTRPQFRVKSNPSDSRKSYPVDIVVFTGTKKTEENVYLIVECKKKKRKDGLDQLQDYLTFSSARLVVWYNGLGSQFIYKHSAARRRVTF